MKLNRPLVIPTTADILSSCDSGDTIPDAAKNPGGE